MVSDVIAISAVAEPVVIASVMMRRMILNFKSVVRSKEYASDMPLSAGEFSSHSGEFPHKGSGDSYI